MSRAALALSCLVLVAPAALGDAQGRPAPQGRPVVYLAELTGSVNPGSAAHLIDALGRAHEAGAEALIIRLDTPGGLLSSTRDLVQALLSAKVPVIVWVGPPGARAGSAGVFLTLAAHVAAMAPSSNIGAAHPVGIGGQGGKRDEERKGPPSDEEAMAEKVENDTAAFMRGIAERRGRNAEWAEQAVRDSVSVTATAALSLQVIDLIAEDVPELLQKLEGRRVDLGGGDVRTLRTLAPELRGAPWAVKDRVLHFLADPEIAYLVAMLGVLGLMAELYHPGTLVPGVVGVICLLISGISFQMLPVSAGALLLLALGVIFLALELYAGGHGGFIAAAGVCIVIGSLLLVGHVSGTFWADRDFGLGARVVAPVTLALCVISWSLLAKVNQARRMKPAAGQGAMVGLVGVVSEPIESGPGQVMVNGELWTARSARPLPLGARARVLSVDGLTLEVAPEEG